jgi:methionine aminotransferase
MHHKSKLPNLATTIFTTMGKLAQKHQAVNISQGFPNFSPDPKLLSLVHESMAMGHNQYAPMQGVYTLRERISQKIEALYGHYYHPEHEITVTAGATQAIFTAITAFIRPNDEVIVIEPAFDCYAPAIDLMGGCLISMPMESSAFNLDWALFRKKITDKTKMVIINSPHNPTGTLLSKTDMEQLQDALRNTNIILLSDEVYEHMTFDNHVHQSASRFPELASRSIICASFGKTFHVTGWKIGYMTGPKYLMEEFNKVHQYNVFCVNHPMQQALSAYLNNPEPYMGLATFYQEKRDYFLKAIAGSRFKLTPSKGTYFQVVNYTGITSEKDFDFATRLVTEHGIATIPMSVFWQDHRNHNQLRLCFAKTQDTLDKAATILNSINP